MSSSPSGREPLEKLAEEFVARFRRGERPALAEYTDRYPELAAQIRELFPALVTMENLGSVEEAPTGPYSHTAGPLPDRLGEYRLLREVGKGGMGVVYEAVQESLGRHVALKVLPPQVANSPTYLERFRREARAAAQLHHTNIVPVFGVGEDKGVHFYAMQFIQGQSLDAVVQEVRRLRLLAPAPVRQGGPPPAVTVALPAFANAGSLAQGLLTGGFECPALDPQAIAPAVPTRTDPAAETSDSHSSLTGQTEDEYFRSVARLGVQAADALAYAHRQGILHRDVKPSNLLLDTQGTVWITDFGLAKLDDGGDLTGTGDVVGTLRFMAPERFRGVSEPRSDVYSLGLTLYEMLTLRPSFADSDRLRLIERIKGEEPPRPRQLNRRIPRDLETVVLKAMAKEPAGRYATAAALAEDLRRFLTNRPIQARHIGPSGRAWRWCRRNPVVAGLLATVLVSLTVGLAVSLWQWRRAEAHLEAATRQRGRAEARLSLARQAVDDLLTEVGDKRLKDIREMDPVRRTLLRKAQAFYERILEEADDDPEIRKEAALAYRRVGEISLMLGLTDEAEAAFGQALALERQLVAEFPGDPKYRIDLALTQLARGVYLNSSGKPAEPAWEETRDICRELVQRYPTELEYQARLAQALNNLGVIYHRAGRLSLAAAAYEEAARLLEPLILADPGPTEYAVGLAVAYDNLGLIYRATGKWATAEAAYHKAREIHERLGPQGPREGEQQEALAVTNRNLGWLYMDQGQPVRALGPFQTGVGILERLVRDHPSVPSYRGHLANLHLCVGWANQVTGNLEQAEAAYQAALKSVEGLGSQPDALPDHRMELARSYIDLGWLAHETGKQDQALAPLKQALTILEPLAASQPTVLQYQKWLGQAWHTLGMVHQRLRPNSTEARASYEKALAIRERLAQDHPEVQEYQHDLAWTCNNLSNLYNSAGRSQEAQALLARTVAIRERLARELPSHRENRAALARSLFTLSYRHSAQGETKQGIAVLRQVVAVQEQLVKDFPDDLPFAVTLGGDCCDLGSRLSEGKDYAAALESFGRAERILAAVLERDPRNEKARRFLGNVYSGQAYAHRGQGQKTEALAAGEKAVALREVLAREQPDSVEAATGLGGACSNLGNRLRENGQYQAALDRYTQAIQILEAARQKDAKNNLTRQFLVTTYTSRAILLSKYLGRHAEALRDLDQAQPLAASGQKDYLRTVRAFAVARTGDHAQAVAEAETVLKAKTPTAQALANAAGLYALAAAAARADTQLPLAEREPRAEAHASRAIALLREALAKGYQPDTPLRDDADFAALGARADFQELARGPAK
jgi:serine/threonine protein kinase